LAIALADQRISNDVLATLTEPSSSMAHPDNGGEITAQVVRDLFTDWLGPSI
jgi:hypothetical protein